MTHQAGYLMPRIGSLCSGYGGLELGLITAIGGSVAWHVEYDKHPSAVLEARFPGVPNYGDVTTTDWAEVEPVDWLTAGYPCQPFSHAGKRRGSADDRHLWPAVRDAVGVLRPGNVLLENVAGHVSLGLDAVLADLAALGYDARWGVVRAADAGAPHARARVFIVATDTRSAGARRDRAGAPRPQEQDRRGEPGDTDASSVHHDTATDTRSERHGGGQDGRSLGRVDSPDEGEARQRERPRAITGDRGATAPADAAGSRRSGAEDGRAGADDARQGSRRSEPQRDGGARTGAAAPDANRGRCRLGPEQHGDPAQAATDRDSCREHADGPAGAVAWGDYEPAICRWGAITGRPAPRPTDPHRVKTHTCELCGCPDWFHHYAPCLGQWWKWVERLSPLFVEWMMGLPDGWVTDVLAHGAALKALGNGVVPQQAALAVSVLHHRSAVAA